MPVIHSFDVFDTALLRRVAFPTDVFRLVARAIARGGDAALTDFEEAFVSTRIAAEEIARAKAAPREDCTLEAIWNELRRLLPDLPASAGWESEVAVERENIVANPDLTPRIRALQAAGERVIFISDTFHSRDTVFALLADAGLADRIEQVHVSSEAGLLKASGRLFPHVAAAEGVTSAQLRHLGDNRVSDGRAARSAGVRANVYGASRLNAAEQAVIEAAGGDIAGSHIAAAMRISRLAGGTDGRADLVSAYLGPMAVLQASWALRQAQSRGAARLYFLARDGHVPWRAARELAAQFPGVDCRYAKLSRRSLIAAMPKLGEFGVFWIERSWNKLGLGEIAERVGHTWEDVADAVSRAIPHAGRDYLLTDREEMARFVNVLDDARAAAKQACDRPDHRAPAVRYLREQGMLDDTPFLVFDVGWHLTLQSALKAVLDQNAAKGFAGGLYLGLRIQRMGEALAGPARALLYERPHASDRPWGANTIFERVTLVEHLMGLAPHGSAKSYAVARCGRAEAVEGPISPQRRTVVERICGDVAEFAALLAANAGALGEEEVTRRITLGLTNHFLTAPETYDLSLLEQLEVESDSDGATGMHIAEPWRLRTVLLQAIPYRLRQRMGFSHGPTLWPEASLARTDALQRLSLSTLKRFRRIAATLLGRAR